MNTPSISRAPTCLWVPVIVAMIWSSASLGVFSVIVMPGVILAMLVLVSRKAWLAILVVLAASPLGVNFGSGVAEYFQGKPALRSMGLPRMEFFNVDRSSRCFTATGGCLDSGDEWVSDLPHNAAVRLMAMIFGPPRDSYDGPYPTKDEGLALTSDAPITPVDDFILGNVLVGGDPVSLGKAEVGEIIEHFGFWFLREPEWRDYEGRVRTRVVGERCLIVRISEKATRWTSEKGRDVMIYFDLENRRPFAYFGIDGDFFLRFRPVSYLVYDEE